MTALDVRRFRPTATPSLLLAVMAAPLSLSVLYLWSAAPAGTSPHAMHHAAHADGTAAPAIVFLSAWLLMTAAMMLPSALPLLASLDRLARNRPRPPALAGVAALAYLGVWAVVGVAALAWSAAADAFLLPRFGADVMARVAGGGLVLAGLYGLSPLAAACLRACRRPFGFLARYWRGGDGARRQAARIGAAYGVSCVGCCVPMLGIMFVAGMANLAVLIAMGAVMIVMKTSAAGVRVAQGLSLALVGVGLAVAFALLPLAAVHH